MKKMKIDIVDMDLSGRGIGKQNGKAVFIKGAVTGDTVSYETEITKKRYDIGKLCEIITPSDERCNAECGIFGKCGGCTFLNMSRTLELSVKRRAVESAFRRAGINDVRVDTILSSDQLHYRNKAVLHHDGNGKYGFFTAESHECCGGNDCLLFPDIFNQIVRYTEKYFSLLSTVPPESIMLRIGNGNVMITAQVEAFGDCGTYLENICTEFPQIVSAYECIGYPTSYDSDFRLSRGSEYIKTDFAGVTLRISPKSFFQINEKTAEMLCSEIASELSPFKDSFILDLYCGIGTIGLSVAKKLPNARILGVEINESAVLDAIYNSNISGITNANFVCADAGQISSEYGSPAAVIVDPPRYGLSQSMIKSVLKLKPEKLVYMSCDPGTLAGDALKLISGGYRISRCIAADMFPKCPHVEALCIFEKA